MLRDEIENDKFYDIQQILRKIMGLIWSDTDLAKMTLDAYTDKEG